MTDTEVYNFEGNLDVLDYGRMKYHVIYLPANLLSRLPLGKNQRLRISGDLNGIKISAAVNPSKQGHYIIISNRLRRIGALEVGDAIVVEFRVEASDKVEVPVELERALWANDVASKKWSLLTPGKKRGYCYRVSSAKRSETRQKRIEELIDLLSSTSFEN